MGFEENSYRLHERSYEGSAIEKELSVYRNWFDNPTTDLWRHSRMLSVLDPFLRSDQGAGWLTVGDGRFGTSGIYINRNGGKALATDIDISLLEVARQNGMIPDYAYANAEKLPFGDEQFQYAYCKQSYHHFPRPVLAVYEMLRVSQKAVIFTEPHDFVPTPFMRSLLQKIKHLLKKITGRGIVHHDTGNYEDIGNYVYSISVREFEKIALGLNLPAIAFKRFSDVYIAGVEHELQSESAPLYKKIRSELLFTKLKAQLGLGGPNTIQMIVFKQRPDQAVEKSLKQDGYTVVHFSPNPYI